MTSFMHHRSSDTALRPAIHPSAGDLYHLEFHRANPWRRGMAPEAIGAAAADADEDSGPGDDACSGGGGDGGGAGAPASRPGRWLPRAGEDPVALAEAECAEQLQLWAVAALCRSLSLDNVLTLLNAALLEKQVAVFCPHIGTLCACVLALVPLLRPFVWQSLLLPVTPAGMRGFLEAPVPFVLGLQYKTPEVSASPSPSRGPNPACKPSS
ncbi:hypothetical protein MNEG_16064 [Monoraphidium neglectum]|uniref:UDENN domain-containing protein n=1 Tax=Monoraphidium neglectum TaxID=145388 RepID=A0A0D2LIR3_9CHLO|nr:hypothetical protein MNEG_16064 [Monoraphidium neglectum]KIY91899.1 hypothetical protein MNEG_16064 [Monoraphidium neglectum]|eukprot:XP_013890919.1 hypothetical protein MNEG_16064 [Monoraphidium neglectum]